MPYTDVPCAYYPLRRPLSPPRSCTRAVMRFADRMRREFDVYPLTRVVSRGSAKTSLQRRRVEVLMQRARDEGACGWL